MAIYMTKLKNSIGSHYYHAYKAQTLPEVMKHLEGYSARVISVRHITDDIDYKEGVLQASQRVMDLLRDVQLLAKIAENKADDLGTGIRPEPPKARLATSEY